MPEPTYPITLQLNKEQLATLVNFMIGARISAPHPQLAPAQTALRELAETVVMQAMPLNCRLHSLSASEILSDLIAEMEGMLKVELDLDTPFLDRISRIKPQL